MYVIPISFGGVGGQFLKSLLLGIQGNVQIYTRTPTLIPMGLDVRYPKFFCQELPEISRSTQRSAVWNAHPKGVGVNLKKNDTVAKTQNLFQTVNES